MSEEWKRCKELEGYEVSSKKKGLRMTENWRRSKGFKNYEISEDGKVRNIKTGKVLSNSIDENGDAVVYIFDGKKQHKKKVRRLVAESHLSDNIHGSYIRHKDGNKRNNDVSNLEIRPKRKKIRCLETGHIYNSISECSKDLGMSESSVSKCCNYSFCNNKLGYHFEEVK